MKKEGKRFWYFAVRKCYHQEPEFKSAVDTILEDWVVNDPEKAGEKTVLKDWLNDETCNRLPSKPILFPAMMVNQIAFTKKDEYWTHCSYYKYWLRSDDFADKGQNRIYVLGSIDIDSCAYTPMFEQLEGKQSVTKDCKTKRLKEKVPPHSFFRLSMRPLSQPRGGVRRNGDERVPPRQQ